mgnify:CR=1 FL=1
MAINVLILNGPNLNLLGQREPEVYGNQTLEDIQNRCAIRAKLLNCSLDFRQSNYEGELVDWIQASANNNINGLIINAGAYTHTSVAIHDALKILKIPIIELHITNIYNREEFRHKSLISKIAHGVICGFGTDGYVMALEAINNLLKK